MIFLKEIFYEIRRISKLKFKEICINPLRKINNSVYMLYDDIEIIKMIFLEEIYSISNWVYIFLKKIYTFSDELYYEIKLISKLKSEGRTIKEIIRISPLKKWIIVVVYYITK